MGANETPGATTLADRLQTAIRDSGLFYESHLSRWYRGELSRQQLEREPQMLRTLRFTPASTAQGTTGAAAATPSAGQTLAVGMPPGSAQAGPGQSIPGQPIPGQAAQAAHLPAVGQGEENVEDHVAVPADFGGSGELFALRVTGDSMVDAGILDGDVVVVRRQDVARDGDVVVALLPGPAEDEATVKRLRRRRGTLTLVPENAAMDPVPMPEGGRILGVVSAVLRKL